MFFNCTDIWEPRPCRYPSLRGCTREASMYVREIATPHALDAHAALALAGAPGPAVDRLAWSCCEVTGQPSDAGICGLTIHPEVACRDAALVAPASLVSGDWLAA